MRTAKPECDLLLVHVPAEVGHHYFVMQMAIGLVPLAEYLRQLGYDVSITHLGLERLRSPLFSLAAHVQQVRARVVGFSVNWHWQLGPALEEARLLKAACPQAAVVLGGLTASTFAEDVLTHCTWVDYVIRGDAEVPLERLLGQRDSPHALATLPNLAWRRHDVVRMNAISYVADHRQLSCLSYGISDAVRHLNTYLRTGVEDDNETPRFLSEPAVTLCAGRGCVHTCSFCSGSCAPMVPVTGRRSPSWVDWRTQLRTIQKCVSRGVRHFYLSADVGLREADFRSLFENLQLRGMRVRIDLEAWTLPSKRLLETFRRSVDPASCLILSPTCGSERVRKANRTCFVTNGDYEHTLTCADRLSLNVWLYFTVGLPFETHADVAITRSWQSMLRARYRCIKRIETQPQHIEPGSPMFQDPAYYGIELLRSRWDDFATAGPLDGVGYRTSAFSSEDIEAMAREDTL